MIEFIVYDYTGTEYGRSFGSHFTVELKYRSGSNSQIFNYNGRKISSTHLAGAGMAILRGL